MSVFYIIQVPQCDTAMRSGWYQIWKLRAEYAV